MPWRDEEVQQIFDLNSNVNGFSKVMMTVDTLPPICSITKDVLLSLPPHHSVGRLEKHAGQLVLYRKLWWSAYWWNWWIAVLSYSLLCTVPLDHNASTPKLWPINGKPSSPYQHICWQKTCTRLQVNRSPQFWFIIIWHCKCLLQSQYDSSWVVDHGGHGERRSTSVLVVNHPDQLHLNTSVRRLAMTSWL